LTHRRRLYYSGGIMETKPFELEFEVELEDVYFLFYVEGEASWEIENDSFDYAGTHCTHGQSGTCRLPDYASVQDIDLSLVSIEKQEGKKDFEINILTWKENKDKVLEFEKEWRTRIMEELQEREDDSGSVMKKIRDYYEELRLGI